MTTFLLIATMFIAGEAHTFVLDHNLTREDCQRAVTRGATLPNVGTRSLRNMTLACEVAPV